MAFVPIEELQQYVGLQQDYDVDDRARIEAALSAAEDAVTLWTGRDFTPAITTASARVFRSTGYSRVLRVDDFNSTTGLVVKLDAGDNGAYDTTLTLGSDVVAEPLNARHGGLAWSYDQLRRIGDDWPGYSDRARVEVTARWGWPAVPNAVAQAVKQVAAELFKRKDAPFGVAGFGEFGPVRLSADVMRSVSALLEPYRGHRTIGIA